MRNFLHGYFCSHWREITGMCPNLFSNLKFTHPQSSDKNLPRAWPCGCFFLPQGGLSTFWWSSLSSCLLIKKREEEHQKKSPNQIQHTLPIFKNKQGKARKDSSDMKCLPVTPEFPACWVLLGSAGIHNMWGLGRSRGRVGEVFKLLEQLWEGYMTFINPSWSLASHEMSAHFTTHSWQCGIASHAPDNWEFQSHKLRKVVLLLKLEIKGICCCSKDY